MTNTTEALVLPDEGAVDLESYAKRAYLDYAMSVVMGRALPLLPDGQKPVQRRTLFDMYRLGLTERAKPVKCARFVGDVLGKYHPHGDSSVYDAAVRMAQSFSLRYPLVDGHGNFGSRDGDGAAAMRYTEARLTPFAELLMGELDMGTVDFLPNYDGTTTEPSLLPARLPVLLLNGASGIAVGLATEIPSHNLREVSLACEHLIRNPEATLEDILTIMPGPDFPCGAQIISSPDELAKAYATGRGSMRTRARWTVENLARGQWHIVVTELPPNTSTAKVMAEIEAITNPPIKAGKKGLSQEQLNLKALVLGVLEHISDDSDEAHPVRLVIEPRSSRQNPEELMQVLRAHTSLESNFPLNLVTIGQDMKPQQKGLLQVLQEWVAFRFETVTRRTVHRLGQVKDRMHVLDGRMIAFLNIDEVIEIIRGAEDPKQALMDRFGLSEVQATDILDIRLRQLANLERIKLESELADLRAEADYLNGLLGDRSKMTAQILKEIEADRAKFGDDRRTLIEAEEKVTTSTVVAVSDDPVTLVVSKQGWLRARTGHKVDLSSIGWKPGDSAQAVFETRTSAVIGFMTTAGKVVNVSASAFPTGRGDGVPLSSLADLGAAKVAHVLAIDEASLYLLANSAGYGFLCPGADLLTRQKAGKQVMTLNAGETILAPTPMPASSNGGTICLATSAGKMLTFTSAEMKVLGKGRGLKLVSLPSGAKVNAIALFDGDVQKLTLTVEVKGKMSEVLLDGAELAKYKLSRALVGIFLPGKAVASAFAATCEPFAEPLRSAEASDSAEADAGSEAPATAEPPVPPETPAPSSPGVYDDGDLI